MTDPTGLDYQAAYAALFPGLAAEGKVRLQDLPDDRLKQVDRAARLRRAERERVKAGFLASLKTLEDEAVFPVATYYTERLRKAVEEIR